MDDRRDRERSTGSGSIRYEAAMRKNGLGDRLGASIGVRRIPR
jgi:hypothetical protein